MFNIKKAFLPLIIISIICIIFVSYLLIFKKNKQNINNPINETGLAYNNLLPGKSTINDIKNTLGTPKKESSNGSTTTLEYNSTNPNFNNQILLDSGTLDVVKQIVSSKDNISISELNQKYGNYEDVLYKSSSYNGFNLYIYPSKGLAYIGHQGSGIVLEIWYFKPMSFETFKSTLGKGFSESPVEGQ